MKLMVFGLICCFVLAACAPCQLTATDPVTIYNRPSAAATIFGTLGTLETIAPTVRTADGFYGFDPGVAQAGNVGVFRNRWILKNYQVDQAGACFTLPVVVGPISNLCYVMVMGETNVYANPDTASDIVAILHFEDYAQRLSNTAGWVEVDLNVSSINISQTGWVQEGSIGYNGPCE